MDTIKLYKRFIIVYLKNQMEYRFTFFADMFMQVFTFIIVYLNIWILLNKFHTLQGWTYYEIMLLYNMNFFSYGLSGLFIWTPMRQLEGMVKQGTFDSILIRPINPFLYLLARQFNHVFLGNIILSIAVFYVCFSSLVIHWTITKAVWFAVVLTGAFLIQSAIMILGGCVSFWIVKSTSLIDISIYSFRMFANYPIKIYKNWIQVILTFIIPYAFTSFYPVQYFLNKSEGALFHPVFQYATPVIGVALFTFSYFVWNLGINRYQSVGS